MSNKMHNESHQYNLVITGRVCNGFEKDLAAKNLSSALKISLAKSISLLNGDSICIKQNISIKVANKYMRAFTAKGIESRVERYEPHLKRELRVELAPKPEARKINRSREREAPPKQATHTSPKSTKAASSQKVKRPAAKPKPRNRPALSFAQELNLGNLGKPVYTRLIITSALFAVISLAYLSVGCGLILFLIERTVSLVINGSAMNLSNFIFFFKIPMLLGAFALLLYARPLFPKTRDSTTFIEVAPSQQPKLFKFVNQVCKKLELTPPNKCLFNASATVKARFEPDITAIKRGQLQLHLGLDLFHILKPSQLAGLIASRLWCYRETPSKFLIAFVMFVQERSYNATFDKDGWLEWINQRQDATRNIVSEFILSAVRACVSLSNKVFMCFHVLITLADSGLQKKIQQLADECAARISGSEDFKDTFHMIKRVQHAQSEVLRKMLNSPGPLRLVRDLPALTHNSLQQQPSKIIDILNDDLLSYEPPWYHNKVATHERIIWLEDLDLAPGLETTFSSIQLIANYEKLSEQVSMAYYESRGAYVNSDELVDLSAFIESSKQKEARDEKVQTYFNGTYRQEIFWQFPAAKLALKLSPKKKIALLNNTITRLRNSTPEYTKTLQMLPVNEEQIRNLSIANEVRKAGYGVPKEYFDIQKNDVISFADHFTEIKQQYLASVQVKHKFCELMGTRTLLAISLANRKSDVYLGYRIVELLRELAQQNARLEKIRLAVSFLPIAEARVREKKESNHQQRIQRIFRDVLTRCDEVFQRLQEHQWPISNDFVTAEDYLISHTQRLDIEGNYSVASIVDYYQKVMLALESANLQLNEELATLALKYEKLYKVNRLKVVSIRETEHSGSIN